MHSPSTVVDKLIHPDSVGQRVQLPSDEIAESFHTDRFWKDSLHRASLLGLKTTFLLSLRKNIPIDQLPSAVVAQFESLIEQEKHRRNFLDRQLEDCLKVLDEHNVRAILLHEMDLAKRFYADPLGRPVDQIDLLIPQEMFLKSLRSLGKMGFRLIQQHFEPTQSVAALERQGQGTQLHIHCTLPSRPGFGREAEVWDRSLQVKLPGIGTRVRVLSREDAIVSLVMRRALLDFDPTLIWLNDLSASVQDSPGRGSLDLNLLEALLAEQGALTSAWFAFTLAKNWDSSVPSEVIERFSRRLGKVKEHFMRKKTDPQLWLDARIVGQAKVGHLFRWLLRDKPMQPWLQKQLLKQEKAA